MEGGRKGSGGGDGPGGGGCCASRSGSGSGTDRGDTVEPKLQRLSRSILAAPHCPEFLPFSIPSSPDFASLPPTIMILDASLRQRMIAEEVSRAKGFGVSQVLAVWA